MEKLFSPEGSQSSETSPAPKPPAKPKGSTAKKSGKKSPKRSPVRSSKKASASKKPAAKRAKTPKRAVAKKTGRPLQFVEQTVVRLPKGWLAALNAKCKAKGVGQGEFVRDIIGRAIGKKVA